MAMRCAAIPRKTASSPSLMKVPQPILDHSCGRPGHLLGRWPTNLKLDIEATPRPPPEELTERIEKSGCGSCGGLSNAAA